MFIKFQFDLFIYSIVHYCFCYYSIKSNIILGGGKLRDIKYRFLFKINILRNFKLIFKQVYLVRANLISFFFSLNKC